MAAKDYANMGEMKFEINFSESNIPGLEEGETNYQGPKEGSFDFVSGWAPAFVRAQGKTFLALQIATQLVSGHKWDFAKFGRIKYGPGGRRIYLEITEGLLEKIMGQIHANRNNARESRIAYERERYVEALLELL